MGALINTAPTYGSTAEANQEKKEGAAKAQQEATALGKLGFGGHTLTGGSIVNGKYYGGVATNGGYTTAKAYIGGSATAGTPPSTTTISSSSPLKVTQVPTGSTPVHEATQANLEYTSPTGGTYYYYSPKVATMLTGANNPFKGNQYTAATNTTLINNALKAERNAESGATGSPSSAGPTAPPIDYQAFGEKTGVLQKGGGIDTTKYNPHTGEYNFNVNVNGKEYAFHGTASGPGVEGANKAVDQAWQTYLSEIGMSSTGKLGTGSSTVANIDTGVINAYTAMPGGAQIGLNSAGQPEYIINGKPSNSYAARSPTETIYYGLTGGQPTILGGYGISSETIGNVGISAPYTIGAGGAVTMGAPSVTVPGGTETIDLTSPHDINVLKQLGFSTEDIKSLEAENTSTVTLSSAPGSSQLILSEQGAPALGTQNTQTSTSIYGANGIFASLQNSPVKEEFIYNATKATTALSINNSTFNDNSINNLLSFSPLTASNLTKSTPAITTSASFPTSSNNWEQNFTTSFSSANLPPPPNATTSVADYTFFTGQLPVYTLGTQPTRTTVAQALKKVKTQFGNFSINPMAIIEAEQPTKSTTTTLSYELHYPKPLTTGQKELIVGTAIAGTAVADVFTAGAVS